MIDSPFPWERDEPVPPDVPLDPATVNGVWTSTIDTKTGTVTETAPDSGALVLSRALAAFERRRYAAELMASEISAQLIEAEAERAKALADVDKTLSQHELTMSQADAELADHQRALDQAHRDLDLAKAKYTLSTRNPTAADAQGKPAGAIWEVGTNGTAARRFMLSGGAWIPLKVGSDFLGPSSVGSSQIAADAIIGRHIAADVIDGAMIRSDAIIGRHLAVNSVDSDQLVSGAVTADKLNFNAAMGDSISANLAKVTKAYIRSANIIDLDASTITSGYIDAARIRAGMITGEMLSVDAIDGRLITGAQIRTAASGRRIEVGPRNQYLNGIQIYNSSNVEVASMEVSMDDYFAFDVNDTSGNQVISISSLGDISGNNLRIRGKSGLTLSGGSDTSVFINSSGVDLRTTNTFGDALIKANAAGAGMSCTVNSFGASVDVSGVGVSMSLSSGYSKDEMFLLDYNGDMHLKTSRGANLYAPIIQTSTATGSANVYIRYDGLMAQTSSLKKYKIDIADISVDPELVLNVPVRDWFDKEDYDRNGESPDGLRRVPGVVAEELVGAGLSQFCTFNPDGELTGVMYDRLPLLLIPIVKTILNRLDRLEKSS